MKALRWAAAWAAASVLALSAPNTRATEWIRAESDHFTLYSTLGERDTRAYAHKLEEFRTLSNMLLGDNGAGPQVRFVIYLIKQDDMVKVRPSFSNHVGGVYFNCGEGTSAYAGESLTNIDAFDGEDDSLITLFHEYSHYVMFQHARTYYPQWYVEGFAEFMSTADPGKGSISLGEAAKMRTYTLAQDRWIDFTKVLDPDFGFAGDKHNDDWEIASFYAQSWLLTHYMLSDTSRAQAMNAYFERLAKGEAPIAAWEAATGIPVRTLGDKLRRYSDHMYYLKVPVPDYPDSAITVTPVVAGQQSYLFDRSLLTTCPAPDQGKAILARLEALQPTAGKTLDFQLTLARAHLLYGKTSDAEAIVSGLIEGHGDSFEANYLMGRIYMKEAQAAANAKDRNNLTDAARGYFISAYKINKLDAPNLYYLATSFSDQPGFPEQNTLNAANGAHALAPGVTEYAAFDAFANLTNEKRDEAARLLQPMASNPHDHVHAERARKAIEAIKAGKSVHEVMAMLNSAG
jgi:hypothetical protein